MSTATLRADHAVAGPCSTEISRAATAVQKVLDEWPINRDDAITRFVRATGKQLAKKAVPRAPYHWRFIVIRNYAANAMAIGDGYLLVTDGAIGFADTPSQFAAILAHEIGHQIAGHLCEIDSAGTSSSWSPFGPPQEPPSTTQHFSLGPVTQIYEIEKEIEADRAAAEILFKAGYNPHAMLVVLRKLASDRSDNDYRRRLDALQTTLGGYPNKGKTEAARDEFLAVKKHWSVENK